MVVSSAVILNSSKIDHSLSFQVLKSAGYLLKCVRSLHSNQVTSEGLSAKDSDLEDYSLVILQLVSSSLEIYTYEMVRSPEGKLRTIACVIFWRSALRRPCRCCTLLAAPQGPTPLSGKLACIVTTSEIADVAGCLVSLVSRREDPPSTNHLKRAQLERPDVIRPLCLHTCSDDLQPVFATSWTAPTRRSAGQSAVCLTIKIRTAGLNMKPAQI